MIKRTLLKLYERKIKKLKPKVNISFHSEIPLPSAGEVASLSSLVSKVNSYESQLKEKPAAFFKEKIVEFRRKIEKETKNLEGEEYFQVLESIFDEILPFHFALVREAALRTIGLRHFDVQIVGGIVLHKNKIAEMATGEGKTLVATLAASLNALAGRGVHIVTVNDYLAKRDWEWMGPVYEYLGLSCGVVQQDMDKKERRKAYACDITYGTNNEFGFDYLRDNMATSLEECVQRGHFYAIVDEVDSILIDEARTPLIISGPSEVSTEKYYLVNRAVKALKVKKVISRFDTKEGFVVLKEIDGKEIQMEPQELEERFDAIVEEKTHTVFLTKRGEEKTEALLKIKNVSEDLPDRLSYTWLHYIQQALRAHYLFKKDRDYIVKDGKVIIVDEFTGRLMPGRRWSEGLHQAIEAKEGLKIQEETQTLATITLQNYFRMYRKLAGMTGTAYTEANEFKHIYNLDVVVIPTNRPLVRTHYPDRIYKTKRAKFKAIISEIEELYRKGRPVLVGTTSIDDSEELSSMLKRKGIPHNVLNAKYHEQEAYIVAQAGRLGQVTIATNMAGRGTDIILGGNIDYFVKDILRKNNILPSDSRYKEHCERIYKKYKPQFEEEHRKVVGLGGLHVIGAQRHEARRIDNQLRGRAGRQGDPGSSRFYISLEDDLMRLFGSERIYFLMERFKFPEDEPIEHLLVSRSIEIAQKRVEAHNFEIRKELLKYDDVMNKQREVIYRQRRVFLEREDVSREVKEMIEETVKDKVSYFYSLSDFEGLSSWLKRDFNIELDRAANLYREREELEKEVKRKVYAYYQNLEEKIGKEVLKAMEKSLALWMIDLHWKEHLLMMDYLKEGIYLRGYASSDPLIEYQREAFSLFEKMISSTKEEIVKFLFRTEIVPQEVKPVFEELPKNYVHSEYSSLSKDVSDLSKESSKHMRVRGKKVGRNDPCPCGSGKKYKKCCGRNL
ncbi:MAG: preprotein translocase subunit SecA [Candidatus Omnitrophota bacterium]|nr:MAG: preprotein translocase subunit SecA [Candidatus Omnitrophota bacterium]